MIDRAFLSYDGPNRATLDHVARLVSNAGLGISGRDYTRDELFVVGSPLQQLQAAVVAIVLVTPDAAESELIAREIGWAIDQNKGILGLRLDEHAPLPPALYAAGAEVLNADDDVDLAYLPRAIAAAVRGARVLEMAASRGSGLGAPCRRPTGPR